MAFPTKLLDPPNEPRPAPMLIDEQRAHLAELKTHFSAEGYTLPVAEGNDERSPLTEREMMFLVRGDCVGIWQGRCLLTFSHKRHFCGTSRSRQPLYETF